MKALLLFCLLFFVAWDLGWLAAGVVQTLPWRLRSMRAGALKPQLLDVRTPAEYALFHIPNAINRPDAMAADPASLGLDPKRPVVVVCMTGHRSPFVAKRLATAGYAASNLTWGMLGWKLFGGESVSGNSR
ncbi:rhodanese-like domain-containing protein [Solidesulfovibrio sp.]|jgi:rhodanese-related sulfurtransferase|uniref:rhodanese-like domain-containing protein n=1 Tax=Solidesulfovibrio sp. TaxID=2910990 RepID=UPI000EF007AA|nr:rhodanese-like domain-containing protein [Solidesulfovibrio sp.]MEA5087631.1 rhodanese-like domain-containing protein [Solidesulfovibrio sp.]HCR13749.1 rhodanese-like domain-containing protein [Desulfovibrio sp.]HML61780.1 rhodanese-like domain-containing protein [Solidesulfovibrio sp.]